MKINLLIYSSLYLLILLYSCYFCHAKFKKKKKEVTSRPYTYTEDEYEYDRKPYEEHHNDLVVPATGEHRATLIFLHGAGETGHDWKSELCILKDPFVKLICPSSDAVSNPKANGTEWYRPTLDAKRREDTKGILKAVSHIHDLIETEMKKGIHQNRIMLGGFAQGGAVALHTAITCGRKLAGVIAMSSWTPFLEDFDEEVIVNPAFTNTPVLICHGDKDEVVSVVLGQLTHEKLRLYSKKAKYKKYPGVGFGTCLEEMNDIRKFLQNHLGD